jgi:hypothetical protein
VKVTEENKVERLLYGHREHTSVADGAVKYVISKRVQGGGRQHQQADNRNWFKNQEYKLYSPEEHPGFGGTPLG